MTTEAHHYLGVDTGGTFTDLVEVAADGRISFDKAFSTPSAPEQGIIDVLERLAAARGMPREGYLAASERFAHGTTVSTNALIQRRGAVVGLLTTRGFEDTLEIARGPVGRTGGLPQSKAMAFLHTDPPPPLVPRRLVRGLGERVTASGEIIAPLDPDEAEAAIRALLDAGIESLAVCLLWAFRNPVHERLVEDVARRVAPDLPVSVSSAIAPRIGEFERTVTTVVNAFIGPLTARYIDTLQKRLGSLGLRRPIQVIKSSGGLALAATIQNQAVGVVNSGPIGGLLAARYLGQALGYDLLITADMGGTSFDVGLISHGDIEEQKTPFLDQGLPVHIPSLKVVTIGAGGGSIGWTDGLRLQVGPQSAGADPGPAAYGRGGEHPTVTDALVALGIIDPANFFGGRFGLDAAKARRAIETKIAVPLGVSVEEAAAGIYEVVTARMADLIRKVTVESGHDPRSFCLVSYGGASGAHCALFARQLGIRRVLLPYAAPVFSALGIALSDIVYNHVKSVPLPLTEQPATIAAINDAFAELEARARAEMAASWITQAAEITMSYRIDMRYQGQMNEVSLPWNAPVFSAAHVPALREAFEVHYQKRFGPGTVRRQTPLELISFRADAIKPSSKPPLARLFESEDCAAAAKPVRRRRVYSRRAGWVETDVYDFSLLVAGSTVRGPAVIERDNTTAWLPPGASAKLDVFGNLLIDPADGAR